MDKILTGSIKKQKTVLSANMLIMLAKWQMQNYGRVGRKNTFSSLLSHPFSKIKPANEQERIARERIHKKYSKPEENTFGHSSKEAVDTLSRISELMNKDDN